MWKIKSPFMCFNENKIFKIKHILRAWIQIHTQRGIKERKAEAKREAEDGEKKWHPLTGSGCHDYRCTAENTDTSSLPPSRPHPRAPSSTHTCTDAHAPPHAHTSIFFFIFFFFSMQYGPKLVSARVYQRCWFDGDSVSAGLLAVGGPALVRCRPQLWPGVPVHSLIPHASMVLQGGRKRRR